MTKGATEKSYYWNITRSEVNFTLLALKDPQSCPEKENCTLILSDEGKVIPKSYKVWNKAVALCELHTIKSLKEQSKNHTTNISVLKKNKTTLFVLYSLNLIALLGLGIFTFIIWKKLN